MNIKILSFSCEIEDLRSNNIFFPEIAQKFPGALWVYYFKKRCTFDLEFQTADLTLTLIKAGKVDPTTVAVFQHNLDEEATQLIKLGAIPFLLSMYESPIYCGKFYDSINQNVTRFYHVRIFGSNLFKTNNISHAYFPSFSIVNLGINKQVSSWKDRYFASIVMGNKYVLTRPFYTFRNFQDWVWYFLNITGIFLPAM